MYIEGSHPGRKTRWFSIHSGSIFTTVQKRSTRNDRSSSCFSYAKSSATLTSCFAVGTNCLGKEIFGQKWAMAKRTSDCTGRQKYSGCQARDGTSAKVSHWANQAVRRTACFGWVQSIQQWRFGCSNDQWRWWGTEIGGCVSSKEKYQSARQTYISLNWRQYVMFCLYMYLKFNWGECYRVQ